ELTEQWYALDRAGHYAQAVPLFDALTASFVVRAVRSLSGRREQFSLETLAASARVPGERLPLLQWCMALLEEDGLAECESGRNDPRETNSGDQRGQWKLGDPGELADPLEIWRLLLADFPAYLPEATLAGQAGLRLESVLRGESEGVTDGAALAYLCDASPSMVPVNRALRHTLAKILGDWPPEQRLRVLEVNGGALGLVADLVSELSPERCDYVYAADSEDMAARAAAELEQWPQVHTLALDLERDPVEQGLDLHGFDIVIAAHCLHAASHIDRALGSLRRLLSRDGVLIALERSPERATDLVFGARTGWWRDGAGTAPPRSRLRAAEEWRPELERAGFEEALVLSEPAPDVAASCYLVLARNPEVRGLETDVVDEERRTVLMLGDADGPSAVLSAALGDALHDAGHRPVHVVAGDQTSRFGRDAYTVANSHQGFTDLLGLLDADEIAASDLVHLLGLEPEPQPGSATGRADTHAAGTALMAIQDARCASTLHFSQAFAERFRSGGSVPRLWLVTAGGAPLDVLQVPGIGPRSPAQAPLWGLGRVLMNEHPELRCRLIDLHSGLEPARASRLIDEELRAAHVDGAEDDEVVLSAQTRYVLRLDEILPQSLASAGGVPERVGHDEAVAAARMADANLAVLDFVNPGPLSNLGWRGQARRAPAAGEIQIEVRATGLNFRDVMYAMGMLSDEAVENGFAGASLGLECAGDVVAIGPDVTGFKIGEPVIAFARACFATYVTTPTTAVAHKPPGWTYEAAATVPSAFFTVYYALEHLARLQPRERVLIHGAAGGVGMAAIQYARYRGAEVFATAGSDTKRDFLHLLGVDHVLDSRSLDFADRIMALTDGEGVDVVLNSLSGEAMAKSLSVVRPFGRFLELGKRDFYENSKLGLRPFRNNISYFGIDADQLLIERPDLAGRLFRDMMSQFERGAFRPLVHRSFPAGRAADAFRHMQQSRHIGKIVIGYGEAPAVSAPAAAPALRALELDGDATYLVTGGLTGFGLATARWLANKGARHLALLGRRGMDTPGAAGVASDLRAQGVTVEIMAADVTDHDSLASVLRRIDRELPPLKGIVHAAMVLDDGVMQKLTAERLAKVLAPKILGAWHLHLLTLDLPLDFFVMYSSATTAFGNPGQASYVAANVYLETLAAQRRGEGLPGQVVAWGPIADAGVLADNHTVREGLSARIGGEAIKAVDALRALEQLIEAGTSGVAVVDVDWRVLARSMPGLGAPKFRAFVGRGGRPAGESGGQDVREMLVGLSDEDARDAVVLLLAEQVGKVLRLPADKLDPNLSIYDLGMDSLMAVELHMALEERFGVTVPIMAVTEGATLKQLSARLATQIVGGNDVPEDTQQGKIALLAARHGEDLSDDDVGTIVEDAGRQAQQPGLIR
ncbi:MAG: SDR family NAD(P)-dependent oxidoreductase, partial [Gammaproteobacteria bacterium]